MNISQVIRTKRKTIALQIMPDASLIVRAPRRVSEETIRQLVLKKTAWILKKQRQVRETCQPPVKREFVDGEGFLYLGKWRKLLVVSGASIPLVFNENEFLLSKAYLPAAKRLFEEWYRKKAFEMVSNRITRYVEMTGLRYARISITNAKKRWGSCSFKGNLNFTWRLVMTPVEVLDYVIVHELVHLDEHNHSVRFWAKVRAVFPNYRQSRQWLRDNQRLLNL